jgi:hypothetical protein
MIGFLMGWHLASTALYNYHPFIEYNEKMMVYVNSFEKLSVAGYYTFGEGPFKLRAGITTGYNRLMEYRGATYYVATATDSGLGLFFVPSFEHEHFVAALVGDSVNVGMKWEIK